MSRGSTTYIHYITEGRAHWALMILCFLAIVGPLRADSSEMTLLLQFEKPHIQCVNLSEEQGNVILVQRGEEERIRDPRKMQRRMLKKIRSLRIKKKTRSLESREKKKLRLLRKKRKFFKNCRSAELPSEVDPPDEQDEGSDDQTGGDTPGYEPEVTQEITQHGITFHFEQPAEYGQFANGDYWVKGPVRIVQITPDFTGTRNGFEVNTLQTSYQGFDSRVGGFDAELVPTLPYLAQPGESIVKSISVEEGSCRPCLEVAAVLTVMEESADYSEYFRPAYHGTQKSLIPTELLREDLLPQHALPDGAPSLEHFAEKYRYVQLDHKKGWSGRFMHPRRNMPDYGSDVAMRNHDAAVRLMMTGTVEEKRQALVNYVQAGIDLYQMAENGVGWSGDGGHGLGRKLPIAFAGLLLNDLEMQSAIKSRLYTFCEDNTLEYSPIADRVLFAQIKNSELAYWNNFVDDVGSRTIRDPYKLIDGSRSGDTYMGCCLFKPYRQAMLALHLLPELKEIWNDSNFELFVLRRQHFGTSTQPDICAPADGMCVGGENDGAVCTSANAGSACPEGSCNLSMDNYGITFGPDGAGSCILDQDPSDGIGRLPQNHGQNAGFGHHGSGFGDSSWALHEYDLAE